MILSSRRQLMLLAAGGLILPARLLAQDDEERPERAARPARPHAPRDPNRILPVVPPFTKEAANVRDGRFGQGLSADGRALLALSPSRRRWWLDTNAAAGGDGKSAATPFRGEGQAYGAMRGGDQLMIAGGSILTLPMSPLGKISGISNAFPTLVQSYDRAAPDNEARSGLLSNKVVYRSALPFIPRLSRKGEGASFIAIRGIAFDHRAPENRVVQYIFPAGIDSLFLEQCAFLATQLSLNSLGGTHTHLFRQCAFQGQWAGDRHAQGIYTSGNMDTVIEDCVFHHCGWKMGLDRSASEAEGGPTKFNHALYAAVYSGGILRRSVFVDAASHGAQLRGNWVSHDNVFIACPLALLHGGGTQYAFDAPGGVMALCYRNIFTVSQEIGPAIHRGFGIEVANTRPGSIVEENLGVGPGALPNARAFTASATVGEGYEPNRTTILFERNTNNWAPMGYDRGTRSKQGWPDRMTLTARNNIEMSDHVTFADPRRDGMTAIKSLGFTTLGSFGDAIVADPAKPWAARLADHIRPGYAPRGLRPGAPIKGAVRPDGSWNGG
jgi:hypothetical protein